MRPTGPVDKGEPATAPPPRVVYQEPFFYPSSKRAQPVVVLLDMRPSPLPLASSSMDNGNMIAKRHKTRKRDVYYVRLKDGTRSYIATWKEDRRLTVTDPLATKPRTVEKEAATFDLACRMKAEGEAAERKRQGKPSQNVVERLGQWMMAFKYFEYRGRQ